MRPIRALAARGHRVCPCRALAPRRLREGAAWNPGVRCFPPWLPLGWWCLGTCGRGPAGLTALGGSDRQRLASAVASGLSDGPWHCQRRRLACCGGGRCLAGVAPALSFRLQGPEQGHGAALDAAGVKAQFTAEVRPGAPGADVTHHQRALQRRQPQQALLQPGELRREGPTGGQAWLGGHLPQIHWVEGCFSPSVRSRGRGGGV